MSSKSLVLGVDLGGTNLRAAAVDAAGRVVQRLRVPTPQPADREPVLSALVDALWLLRTRLQEGGGTGGAPELRGVVVGCPGPLDPFRGVVHTTPNLRGWDDFPLADALAEALHLPVLVENDANAATLGEYAYGAGQGSACLVGLTLGTGIGGGIVIGGKLWYGTSFMAGEIGHLTWEPEGRRCGCGNRGCIEQYASASAVGRDGRALAARPEGAALLELAGGRPDLVDARLVAEAAAKGDPASAALLAGAARALGAVLAGVCNLLNPDRIVLGGGMAAAGPPFFEPLRDEVHERAWESATRHLRILPGALGDDAGILGAAFRGFQELPETGNPEEGER